MLLADYASYIKVQDTVGETFLVKLISVDNNEKRNVLLVGIACACKVEFVAWVNCI